MLDQRSIHNLNTGIEDWNKSNKQDLLKEMDALGIKHYKYSKNKVPLRRALKDKLKKRFDLVNKISYSMPRSAVFLHKGVSRGHGKSNPREAKEWFNPVVDKNLDTLADIVADGQGDLVINSINIK